MSEKFDKEIDKKATKIAKWLTRNKADDLDIEILFASVLFEIGDMTIANAVGILEEAKQLYRKYQDVDTYNEKK